MVEFTGSHRAKAIEAYLHRKSDAPSDRCIASLEGQAVPRSGLWGWELRYEARFSIQLRVPLVVSGNAAL